MDTNTVDCDASYLTATGLLPEISTMKTVRNREIVCYDVLYVRFIDTDATQVNNSIVEMDVLSVYSGTSRPSSHAA